MDPDIALLNQLVSEINHEIKSHDGAVELISFEAGIVSLKFNGACQNCPMSFYTLKYFVEEKIRSHLPSVTEVISV